jgi:predicted nucleic acid-binding protein
LLMAARQTAGPSRARSVVKRGGRPLCRRSKRCSNAERDALIAATALVHGLRVVTRNVADFAPMGVELVNPWE